MVASRTVPLLALALAAAAGIATLLHVRSEREMLPHAGLHEPTAEETARAPRSAGDDAQLVAAAGERPAGQQAKLEELRAMSETFRNTTFLIAIRAAGFVCEEVVEGYRSSDDAAAWRVRCRDLRAYHVAIDPLGSWAVEPTADLWDGLYPPRIEGNESRGRPELTPFGPPR